MQVNFNFSVNIDDRIIGFFKRIFTIRKIFFTIMIALITVTLNASVPFSFTAGTTIIADDVNSNFNALDTRITTLEENGHWSTDSTNVYRQTGNVGIGTADPSWALHVNGLAYMPTKRRLGNWKTYELEAVYANKDAGSDTTEILRFTHDAANWGGLGIILDVYSEFYYGGWRRYVLYGGSTSGFTFTTVHDYVTGTAASASITGPTAISGNDVYYVINWTIPDYVRSRIKLQIWGSRNYYWNDYNGDLVSPLVSNSVKLQRWSTPAGGNN